MRLAKADIYSQASSIPTLKFEEQQLTSFAGLVVFQKLFESCRLKARLRVAMVEEGLSENEARARFGSLTGKGCWTAIATTSRMSKRLTSELATKSRIGPVINMVRLAWLG